MYTFEWNDYELQMQVDRTLIKNEQYMLLWLVQETWVDQGKAGETSTNKDGTSVDGLIPCYCWW